MNISDLRDIILIPDIKQKFNEYKIFTNKLKEKLIEYEKTYLNKRHSKTRSNSSLKFRTDDTNRKFKIQREITNNNQATLDQDKLMIKIIENYNQTVRNLYKPEYLTTRTSITNSRENLFPLFKH